MSTKENEAQPESTVWPATRKHTIVAILVTLYLPQVWFFFLDESFNDGLFFYLIFFLGLPSVAPALLLALAFRVTPLYPTMWAITPIVVLGTILLCFRFPAWRAVILMGLLFWSFLNAGLGYLLFTFRG